MLRWATAPIKPPSKSVGLWIYLFGQWLCDDLAVLFVVYAVIVLLVKSPY